MTRYLMVTAIQPGDVQRRDFASDALTYAGDTRAVCVVTYTVAAGWRDADGNGIDLPTDPWAAPALWVEHDPEGFGLAGLLSVWPRDDVIRVPDDGYAVLVDSKLVAVEANRTAARHRRGVALADRAGR